MNKEESKVAKQLKKASEEKDRVAFAQLIVEIRETIWLKVANDWMDDIEKEINNEL